MSDIHEGRFLQWKGRLKRAWGALIDDAQVEAEGNADVVSGKRRESSSADAAQLAAATSSAARRRESMSTSATPGRIPNWISG